MPDSRDAVAKAITGFHKLLFDTTKGRIGGTVMGMPTIKLTTTGRKSGKPRDTMLTAPIRDDDKVVIVASYGGAEHHPVWYLNLRDNPEVTVTMSGRRRPMIARTASADEKAELWPKITDRYNGYAGYQRKTDRDIPVVILEPV
jgi:deazaflavin-dependent oxidoreductase (nitroreductase family)